MLQKPQFKPCYSVETIDTDQVFFLSERETAWLSDRLSASLAALIDGDTPEESLRERNNDEIIDTHGILPIRLMQKLVV